MFRYIMSALALAALISILSMSTLRAHEGHDDAAKLPAASVSASPRGEAHSEKFELVVVAQAGALMIYLDDYRTNTPIEKASVEIETPDGPKTAMPVGNGTYRLDAPFLASGGHLDLIVTVTVGDSNDILPLSIDIPEAPATAAKPVFGWFETFAHSPWATGLAGFVLGGALVSMLRRRRPAALAAGLIAFAFIGADPVRAHEGHDDAPKPAQAASDQRAQREPDGSVFVPKPVQRIFGLRTILTEAGSFVPSVELPGRVIPDPNASGYVQTAIGGRLTPPPGGFPRLGTPVKQGDVLAYLTPPIQAIDVSDMRQKQGELDQQISIVQRRLVRYESLVASGAVARTQVEDTKLELEGLRDRRAALDTMRLEPVPLLAPVSGVIAEGTPITGQIAQSNAVVFQIVTPGKLWIEALSFDAVAGSGRASAKTGNGVPLKLVFRGSGLADRSQSIPVHFAIEGDTKVLRAGQFVTVFTESGDIRQGIAVPRNAVVRAANGQEFVFEHVSAERFEPRAVRTEPLDAERVIVAAGLEPGKRVVVLGAELLDHVR
jgi:RND family efflux transporter MFP subunit